MLILTFQSLPIPTCIRSSIIHSTAQSIHMHMHFVLLTRCDIGSISDGTFRKMTYCIVGCFVPWNVMPSGTFYHRSFQHLGHIALGHFITGLFCSRMLCSCIVLGPVGYTQITFGFPKQKENQATLHVLIIEQI